MLIINMGIKSLTYRINIATIFDVIARSINATVIVDNNTKKLLPFNSLYKLYKISEGIVNKNILYMIIFCQ